jgi:N,N-dimethylformamidase
VTENQRVRLDADPGLPLQGYVDAWEARPGGRLSVMTSCLGDAYDAQIVRVVGGPPKATAGPSPIHWVDVTASCAGQYPAQRVQTVSGSYAVQDDVSWPGGPVTLTAWVYPTLPQAGRRQVVLRACGTGQSVSIELTGSGHFAAVAADAAGAELQLHSTVQVRPYTWFFVAAVVDKAAGLITLQHQEISVSALRHPAAVAQQRPADVELTGRGTVYVGVHEPVPDVETAETTVYQGSFNGKIEAPAVLGAALSPDELVGLATGPASAVTGSPTAVWSADFAREPEELAPLRIVNSPMRRMTAHIWRGQALDWRVDPAQWAAIWFHDDDLDDAHWPEAFHWDVPADAAQGLYAVRLSNDLGEDLVPFFVSAPAEEAVAPLAILIPTFSYTAYSNFWHIFPPERGFPPGPEALYLSRHPELGMSMYMRHRDGSGISHVSWRRPMLDMRLDRRLPTRGNAGREVSGDLYLIEWLEQAGIPYDIVTDLEVHTEGAGLLGRYRCVLTGGHPEYVSGEILDALESYVDGGGRLMYLGGNGFYWVTTLDRHTRHLVEVRRGRSGSRTWTGMPAEQNHTDTGEPGGHWRDRGRAPQVLTGVGFAAQGGGPSTGYIRTPASEKLECAFVFEGIGREELIGGFGDKGGGAAGDELDRADALLGTSPATLILATSAGLHDAAYQHAIEEAEEMNSHEGGDESPEVRADMTLFTNEAGGAVFSVGSIAWSASLAYNFGDNNVARLTRNVIEQFLK